LVVRCRGTHWQLGTDNGVLDKRVRVPADVHAAHLAAGFHAGGGVHGIAPDVVLEFLHAHDAGHHGSGVDAGAHAECEQPLRRPLGMAFGHERLHLQGCGDHIGGRGVLRVGQAAGAHVGIADGLDLLDAAAGDDLVEGLEAGVEFGQQFRRPHLGAHGGESLEIGEQHGDLVEVLGLGGAVALQFFGHLLRQDVQQQLLGSVPLLAQFRRAFAHFLVQLIALAGEQAMLLRRANGQGDDDGERDGDVVHVVRGQHQPGRQGLILLLQHHCAHHEGQVFQHGGKYAEHDARPQPAHIALCLQGLPAEAQGIHRQPQIADGEQDHQNDHGDHRGQVQFISEPITDAGEGGQRGTDQHGRCHIRGQPPAVQLAQQHLEHDHAQYERQQDGQGAEVAHGIRHGGREADRHIAQQAVEGHEGIDRGEGREPGPHLVLAGQAPIDQRHEQHQHVHPDEHAVVHGGAVQGAGGGHAVYHGLEVFEASALCGADKAEGQDVGGVRRHLAQGEVQQGGWCLKAGDLLRKVIHARRRAHQGNAVHPDLQGARASDVEHQMLAGQGAVHAEMESDPIDRGVELHQAVAVLALGPCAVIERTGGP